MRKEDDKKNLFAKIWEHKRSNQLLKSQYAYGENERIDKTLKMIDRGDTFLDIGGGSGILCSELLIKFNTVVTTEVTLLPLKISKNNNINSILHDFNFDNLPFSNNTFDTISLLAVLQYINDPILAFSEIFRVLKPNGMVYIGAPNMRASWRILKLTLKGEFPRTCMDPIGWDGGAIHYFCSKDLITLLNKNGFKVINKKGIKFIPNLLNFFDSVPIFSNFVQEFFSAEFLIEAQKCEI